MPNHVQAAPGIKQGMHVGEILDAIGHKSEEELRECLQKIRAYVARGEFVLGEIDKEGGL
jgi:hypothetical protein